jgi:hypothetical protein
VAVPVVQSNSASTIIDPATVVLGGAPTAGNTLLAIMASDTTIQNIPFAGTGNTYTQRLAQVGGMGFYVWTRLVVGGDSATTTFDITGANNATLMVFEIAGTYDKIGAGATSTSSATTRTATGLSPATTDNLVVAIAGMHSTSAVGSGGSADNGFALLRAQFAPTAGTLLCNIVTASKATASTVATGTTTLSWTGAATDRDGVQIAFTALAGGAPPSRPPLMVGEYSTPVFFGRSNTYW